MQFDIEFTYDIVAMLISPERQAPSYNYKDRQCVLCDPK